MENETQVVKYDITNAAIQEMSEMYLPLFITDLEDKEQFDAVHSARMVVRGKRIEVDKRRKELKADALAWGKLVQTEANRIFDLIEPIETHLKNEEGKAEAERQRIENERIATVRSLVDDIPATFYLLEGRGTAHDLEGVIIELEALQITPEVYFEFTSEAFTLRDDILNRAKQALVDRKRLDAEEAERKAESERLAVEREKQEEEAAKLKAQQDLIDEQNRKLQAAKDALEADKKAEQERKERLEFEQKAVEKAKVEAIEKAKQDAIDKAEKEKAEAAEAERQESLKPDREKLEGFAQFLVEGITYPTIESKGAGEIIADAAWALEKLSNSIFEKAQEM